MKYKWINNNSNKNLILFFNGWGMDDCVIKHLDCQNFDVLMFYDYNTLETEFCIDFINQYQKKYLIAWSMGVMIGSIYLSKYNGSFNSTIAINGTLKPIDDEYGIHPKIYDLTIKGFDEKGRNRFINSMFLKKQEINPSRNIQNQHSELIALKNYKSNTDFKYTKVIISDNDKIIPTKSQVKFWGVEPNIKAGHCPFFEFEKWSELL